MLRSKLKANWLLKQGGAGCFVTLPEEQEDLYWPTRKFTEIRFSVLSSGNNSTSGFKINIRLALVNVIPISSIISSLLSDGPRLGMSE